MEDENKLAVILQVFISPYIKVPQCSGSVDDALVHNVQFFGPI